MELDFFQLAVGWEVRQIKLSQVVSQVCAFAFMYKKVNYILFVKVKNLKTK